MHVLVLCVALFIVSLYLLSIQALYALSVILLLLAAVGVRKRKRMLLLMLIMPVLAGISLCLYSRPQIPEKVRIVKVYGSSLVVSDGFRKYLISDELFKCEEGEVVGGVFDMESLPINRTGYAGKLTISKPHRKKDALSHVISFKKSLSSELVDVYGYDNGTLMSSLVLGLKEDISEKRAGDMKRMGIMHILSISGFHFALLENLLKKMKLGRKSILILGLYAIFINSIPGYRTLLTMMYRTVSYYMRRDPDPVTGVFLAMFIQTFICPYIIFKIGFLLTYLSTIGIILFHQKILGWMHHLPSSVSGSLSLTMAALSLSFPVILTLTPEFSLGVFIGNMILVPLYVIVAYLSFACIFILPFEPLVFLLLPFVEVFFDFSYHMGNFMSQYILTVNLEHLIYSYAILLFTGIMIFRKGAKKRGAFFIAAVLIMGLPWGTTVKIYNNFGVPSVRITHNFRNYDIMDYRVAEAGYIPIRKAEKLNLQSVNLKIRPSENDREIPHIFVNEKELALPRRMEYYGGVKIMHKYVFWNERVMKVR